MNRRRTTIVLLKNYGKKKAGWSGGLTKVMLVQRSSNGSFGGFLSIISYLACCSAGR